MLTSGRGVSSSVPTKGDWLPVQDRWPQIAIEGHPTTGDDGAGAGDGDGDGYDSSRVSVAGRRPAGGRASSRECRNSASASTRSPRTSAPTSSATRRQRVTPLWVTAKWKFSTVALRPSTGSPS